MPNSHVCTCIAVLLSLCKYLYTILVHFTGVCVCRWDMGVQVDGGVAIVMIAIYKKNFALLC